MSMRWIAVSTDLLDVQHDLHPHRTGSPACELGAWIDLIGMAAWKRRGDLRRGEVRASVRFLAERWNWSKGRVSRFLAGLEDADRIVWRRRPEARRTPGHITICNYEEYQSTRDTRTEADHKTGHERVHKTGHRSDESASTYGDPRDTTRDTSGPTNGPTNGDKALQVQLPVPNVGLRPTAEPSVENSGTANGSHNDESENTEPWNVRLAPVARRAAGRREDYVARWLAWAKLQLKHGVSVDDLEARIGGLCEMRDRSVFPHIEKGEGMLPAVFERDPQLRQQAEAAWHRYGPNRGKAIVRKLVAL